MTRRRAVPRTPTPEQRAKERAVLYTAIADVAIVAGMAAAAIGTGSLTMLGEATRGGLMTAIEIYALVILCAVHRDQLRRFHYGIGKVEQIVNLVIGASLCLSGVWVAQRMLATLLAGELPAAPLDMAVAAVVNAINLLINLLGWVAMLVAARGDDSPIYVAQRRARGVKLACSVLLQSALTIAALARDPVVALGLDAAGAVFVSGLMLVLGWRMIAECAPDLLDHGLEGEDGRRLLQALTAAAGEGTALVRTRRSGGRVQAELVLAVPAGQPCAEVKRQVRHLHDALAAHLPQAHLGVIVEVAPARGGAPP